MGAEAKQANSPVGLGLIDPLPGVGIDLALDPGKRMHQEKIHIIRLQPLKGAGQAFL